MYEICHILQNKKVSNLAYMLQNTSFVISDANFAEQQPMANTYCLL